MEGIGRVLFIRIDRIGDMALATPALEAIKTALPHAALTALASPANAPLFVNNPYVDRVFVYDCKTSLRHKRSMLKDLRASRFDLAIDPTADWELKTALIACLSGARATLGYASFGRECLFSLPGPAILPRVHFIDENLNILSAIGIDSPSRKPRLYLAKEETQWAKDWIEGQGLGNSAVIGLHPGAFYESQRWPAAYYAELIRMIRIETSMQTMLFGGAADKETVEAIRADAGFDMPVFVGNDLRKFLALLSQCRILICNNSGPLHCAVSLDVPTISFMGPTDKERWMPVGSLHHVLRRDELPCIGCNLGVCKIKTHDCMRLIEPTEVMELLKDKIA